MSNGLPNYQNVSGLADYDEAANWTASSDVSSGKRVTGFYYGSVLFRKDTLAALGDFDEELESAEYVIEDYCLRMILNDWKLKVCGSSLVWSVSDNEYERNTDPMEWKRLKQKWGMNYFNTMYNERIIEMIKDDKDAEINVLEVGCDCGATLLEIQNRYPNAHLYGSELNEKAVQIASHFAVTAVNNIEEENLMFESGMFDYIIFGDVLEHLRDPLRTIQYCRGFLRKGGSIIASIPNLMHITVMEGLMNGNFTYTDKGLLDKTHIHLFTFNEIVKMFQAGGYIIKDIKSLVLSISKKHNELIDRLLDCGGDAERWMYETFQYIVCAQWNEDKEQ